MTGGRGANFTSLLSVEFFGPQDCTVADLPEPRSGHVTFVTSEEGGDVRRVDGGDKGAVLRVSCPQHHGWGWGRVAGRGHGGPQAQPVSYYLSYY